MAPERRAILFNTDTIERPQPATEIHTASSSRITNPVESKLIAHLLTALIRSGVPPKSIGVITFYRSQLALLRHDVKAIAGTSAATDVEMHTADKYQGRDKEVILLSCVRSNPTRNVGELLKDWRRVNVAITRARSKLIIFGSRGTLAGCEVPVLEGLVKIMQEKKWVVDLPSHATEGHAFEQLASCTQTQTQRTTAPVQRVTGPVVTEATAGTRQPLTSIDGNVTAKHTISNTSKAHAPFKQPKRVVKGMVDIENVLDKRPIMRDVMNDVLGVGVSVAHGGSNTMTRVGGVTFDENDFDDDDEMLIDF